jgi:SOS-response transcriptional repressor LexA
MFESAVTTETPRMPMEAKYGKSIEPQKHRKVYDFIEQYQKDHGTSPHLQLIADGCGIARATISNHIKVMEKNGYLSRDETRTGIRLNPEYARGVYVKVSAQ